MKNKLIAFTSLFIASSAVFAVTPNITDTAGKQIIQEKATAAVPGATAASQTVDNAKTLKSTTEAAPAAVKDQAKDAVVDKATSAVPAEATNAAETVKSGKTAVEAVPKVPALH